MDKTITFKGAIAEIASNDFLHPGLRRVKVIYCDDQPNSNKQGVKHEDFPDIIKTAPGTPLKVNFKQVYKGKPRVKGHAGAIPIGFIQGMTEAEVGGVHQLIADGIIFANEFPAETEYLETAFANNEAPNVSFEMLYDDEKSIIEDGIQWLKGLVAKAATFVEFPAYGNRTAILALASNNELNADEFLFALAELLENSTISPKNTTQGGNNIMTEEEIKRLQAELETAKSAIAQKDAELEEKDKTIQDLTKANAELTDANTQKDAALAEFSNKEKIAERTAALTEAEINIEIKPERLLKMDDDSFNEYVADLKAASAAAKTPKNKVAIASTRGSVNLPKFTPPTGSGPTEGLAERLKGISRNRVTATE